MLNHNITIVNAEALDQSVMRLGKQFLANQDACLTKIAAN